MPKYIRSTNHILQFLSMKKTKHEHNIELLSHIDFHLFLNHTHFTFRHGRFKV